VCPEFQNPGSAGKDTAIAQSERIAQSVDYSLTIFALHGLLPAALGSFSEKKN
jgi:hypothetical protein